MAGVGSTSQSVNLLRKQLHSQVIRPLIANRRKTTRDDAWLSHPGVIMDTVASGFQPELCPGQDNLLPATPQSARKEDWWARQDSNLGPRDSLYPPVSKRSGLSHHPQPNC